MNTHCTRSPVLSFFLWAGLIAPSAMAGINDVRHSPVQPRSNQTVLITARIDLLPLNAIVRVQLQTVAPGQYIRKSDPAYETEWTAFQMKDDGQAGDARANDGVFTVQIPADQQKHRTLYRYRITVTDGQGKSEIAPDAKAGSPNFAWFCYDGVPAWAGSREPGKPARQFSAAFLSTIEPYHLIARADDVATSQWDGNAHKKRFPGTFVYSGVVYDHIAFHNRGQGSAHISGKNKWALKFNADQPVPLKDNTGKPYLTRWTGVDLNPGTHTPYLPVLRGIAGLDEAVSFRAHQLVGGPSSSTHWVHFRVIDGAAEASEKSQHEGDLWGLYLAVGDIDEELLAEQRLPDGLLVSIQSGIKHQPKGATDGQKQWDPFIGTVRSDPTEAWWRANLHLHNYFSFHAINRLIGNVDIRPDGNHGYYRAPDGKWSPIPWDNDMCFVPRHHQPGHIDAVRALNHAGIKLEYQNRAREILDLFAADATPAGGQIGQLVAELGRVISPAGHEINWAQLDEAMWNSHPRFNQRGSYFVNPAFGDHFGGRWERKLATNDFQGFQKYLVDFCTDSRPVKNYAPNDGNPLGYGWGYVAHEARDDKIPSRPAVLSGVRPGVWQYRIKPMDNAAGKLRVEWRVGRVGVQRFEIQEHWRSTEILKPDQPVVIAPHVFKEPGTYRVRARLHDEANRAGHWSEAVVEVVR